MLKASVLFFGGLAVVLGVLIGSLSARDHALARTVTIPAFGSAAVGAALLIGAKWIP